MRIPELKRCPVDGTAMVRPEVFAAAEGDPFLGITIANRFVIVDKLGAGSMGTVYRARQEAIGRDVAIKVLRSDRAFDAQAKTRFTREARAMSLLTSPHTVTVFDFGEIVDNSADAESRTGGADGSLYLAMELLEGESLGQRLKRLRRLPLADAIRFSQHALLSLAEAHDKGIIHRDLKPDNLFLAEPPLGEREEICKVLDFGIAKVVSNRERVDALETQAGTVFGTPRYMSPEQAQGGPLDARSDLYSLGVLLYHMLVGRPPFTDDDAVIVMAKHIKAIPAPAMEAAPDAGIPKPISELLQRVLAKDPADRPTSAKEFIQQLERAVHLDLSSGDGDPSAAGEVSATGELLAVVGDELDATHGRAARRAARRTWAALVAAAATTAATLIALTFALGGSPRVLQEAHSTVAREANLRTKMVRLAMSHDIDPPRSASSPAPPLTTATKATAKTRSSLTETAPAALDPKHPKPSRPDDENR